MASPPESEAYLDDASEMLPSTKEDLAVLIDGLIEHLLFRPLTIAYLDHHAFGLR